MSLEREMPDRNIRKIIPPSVISNGQFEVNAGLQRVEGSKLSQIQKLNQAGGGL